MNNFLYINTRPAACSIYQAGLMIYQSIQNSNRYTMDYASIDELDKDALHAGKIIRNGTDMGTYDAYIFNYHYVTMREMEHIRSEEFHKLPGAKYAVIFEMLPDDPIIGSLQYSVTNDDFTGYIVVDPTMEYADHRFHNFPRPLAKVQVKPYEHKEIPVIGTFGLAGHGRNLANLVRAVNQEFDKAVIRFNFAPGSFFGDVNGVAKNEVLGECKSIAKPGVEILLTEHYFSDQELLEWLGQNTLNVFFYARGTSGLSSACDQAIMSGRPIITSADAAFRHIHEYVPAYPETGFVKAIEIGAEKVAEMQRVWNYENCQKRFEEIIFNTAA
jgi:hypothetical protein